MVRFVQQVFPQTRHVHPPKPTIRSEHVARLVAERIVCEVNVDEFYWTRDEVPDRIADVAKEIMRCGRPATVFGRLWRQQPPVNCRGDRGRHREGGIE